MLITDFIHILFLLILGIFGIFSAFGFGIAVWLGYEVCLEKRRERKRIKEIEGIF